MWVRVQYDKRVKEILEKLESGRSRESISEDYNYSTWKSLDVYMRRLDFLSLSLRKIGRGNGVLIWSLLRVLENQHLDKDFRSTF